MQLYSKRHLFLAIGACALLGSGWLSSPLLAQSQRSAWMWKASSHPYGTANVIGDPSKESELISYFGAWGFDRVYASVGNKPIDAQTSTARWNAALDDVGIDAQSLYGLTDPNPTSLANRIQTKLIDFNVSRADPRERFDAVHLDLEPHALNTWKDGTPAIRRGLLADLRDSYVAARAQLDDNGAAEMKLYADLPVWYDSSANIAWPTPAERDQWFDDIAVPLDGITLMAFGRDSLSSITSGVDWEVANFNGDVRIGLNVNEVGPGDTFEDMETLMAMADLLESHYGTDISGIDFQSFATFSDLTPVPILTADFDEDGDTDGADFLAWQRGYGIESGATLPQGDANGNGSVSRSDLFVWKRQFGPPAMPGALVIPEPSSWTLVFAGFLGMFLGSKRSKTASPFRPSAR